MDNGTLRILQLLELKILLEIKRICEKHHINYFLIGGTLLGAVRHRGFIPWDDDIDIGLRRVEYEKFLKIAEHELGPEYFLQTHSTDPKYTFSYAKIRLLGTEFNEPMTIKIHTHKEIWVDVFPFDNIPDGKIKQKVHIFILRQLDGLYLHKIGCFFPKSKNIIKRLAQMIFTGFSKILPKKIFTDIYDLMLQKPNKHASKLVWNCPFYDYNSEYIASFSTLSFEGIQFQVPNRYHEYLTRQYGNYMQLPSENEQRKRHSPYEPTFGKYADIREVKDLF